MLKDFEQRGQQVDQNSFISCLSFLFASWSFFTLFHIFCAGLLVSTFFMGPFFTLVHIFCAQVYWLNCSASVAATIEAIAGQLFLPISGLHQVETI